jgi:hypothetical protein
MLEKRSRRRNHPRHRSSKSGAMATDGTACPERETEPTEVDFNAAGIGLQS